MLKIAIIAPETKPIPAAEGGAVETIVDTFIKYNDLNTKHSIDIYSKYHKLAVNKVSTFKFTKGKYVHINTNTLIRLLQKFRISNLKNIYINKILKIFEGKDLDWIIIENRPEYVLPIRKKFSNIKIALHMHNEHLTIKSKKAKEIVHATDKIITVSNFIADGIKQIDPAKEKKISTLYNRVDIEKFKPTPKSAHLSSIFKVDSSTIIVLLHGRIIKEKGILEAIQSFNLAKLKNKNLKLIIIGDVNTANLEYKKLILEEVQKYNHTDDIIFTGYIDHSLIPDYLNLSDIIILPSIWDEPCALAILESLAIGKPLITTRTGGTPEIVPDNCGIIVDVDKDLILTLTKAIEELSNNKELRDHFAISSRNFAISNLDDKKFFNDFLQLLN